MLIVGVVHLNVFVIGFGLNSAFKYICVCLCLDFMSLELREGYPVLLVDFGTGTVKIEHRHIKVSDGEKHRIDIIWTKTVSD